MRINCQVHSANRQEPHILTRITWSSLAIAKRCTRVNDASDLFIHICNIRNKQGNKYKILHNIQAIYTNFIGDGRFTIQLQEPPLDLCVKTEPGLARGFVRLLKLSLKNTNLERLPYSPLKPVKQNQIGKLKKKLLITRREDYPLTKPFPCGIEALSITDIDLTRIENRIMNLKHLCNLDLSKNRIIEIPMELGNMNCLSVLNLKSNKISKFPEKFFLSKIRETLVSLDLSYNEMEVLPNSLLHLKKLDTLILSSNKLRTLPISIDKITKLKHLNVSQNHLQNIPASLQNLLLQSLDVSGNPLDSAIGMVQDRLKGGVPSLKNIAATSCIQQQLQLCPSEVPYFLCNYLDNHLTCLCGKILFESYLFDTVLVLLKRFSYAVTSNRTSVPAAALFCSRKCWSRYKRYY